MLITQVNNTGEGRVSDHDSKYYGHCLLSLTVKSAAFTCCVCLLTPTEVRNTLINACVLSTLSLLHHTNSAAVNIKVKLISKKHQHSFFLHIFCFLSSSRLIKTQFEMVTSLCHKLGFNSREWRQDTEMNIKHCNHIK